jgi:DNA repair protein RadC
METTPMNDTDPEEGASASSNDARMLMVSFAEPERDLLQSVFFNAPFVIQLARAPGGWRTLSEHELLALGLSVEQRAAVLALQVLVQLSYPVLPKLTFLRPAELARIYGHRLGGLMHEVMFAVALDGKCHFLAEVEIATGGAHSLAVRPRDVLRPLLRGGASTFVLVHNHPSGDPTPSPEDLRMTRVVADCADAIGVPMIDHLIIGARGGGYRSLLELGVLERV